MAKTFQQLEEEEMLRRKGNMEKAQTVEEYRREKKRQEREALRLSKVYNKEVYEPFLAGRTPTQVVEQMRGEQRARSAADVAKAREDMASGKTSTLVGKQSFDPNKSTQIFKSMVQGDPTQDRVFDTKEEAEAYLKQTGQKGAVAGIRLSGTPGEIESATNKYRARAEQKLKEDIAEKERPQKEREATDAKITEIWDTRYERASKRYGREMDPKKLYQEFLESRGLREPASGASTAERRKIQEENDRALMDDFRENQRARRAAQLDEASFLDEAKRKGIPKTTLDKIIGGDSSNVSVRRKYFEGKENQKAIAELKARAEMRRAKNTKQTTANPEAASSDRGDFTPKSTAAPIGVGTESLEYGQRPSRADATQQPFGMVPPQTVDRGVDFGALSEANVSGEAVTPETTTPPTPPTPTAPKVKTSANITQEDIQPGISEVRMPPRAEGESVAAYNKRANEEYEKQVILPARQLNSKLEKFKGVWLVPQNRPRIKKIKSDLEKPKEALKDKIKGLRTELRKAPGLQSPEAKFIRFQIETLKNELGIIDKFLI